MYRIQSPFGEDVVLRSIDFLENLHWKQENIFPINKDKYEVNVNVAGFAPEEIKVKIADGFIVIEASHEEKKDELGYISRKVVRRYALPDDCLQDRVESRLSANGILTVSAPRKPKVKDNTIIPVTMEKPAAKSKL